MSEHPIPTHGGSLNDREQTALHLYATGHDLPDIAKELGITPRGVKYLLDSCRAKYGVKKRRHLLGVYHGKGTK